MNRFLSIFLLLLLTHANQETVLAQEIPPIINFSPVDYGAVNQNWSVSQSEDGLIYVANNGGLLVYDGERWQAYASPNGSSMRAVEVIGARAYGGYYMEMGYWSALPTGELEYHSLLEKLPEPMIEGEEIWNIMAVGDWVLFQSLHRIYAFNPETGSFRIIPARNNLARMFRLGDSIYFQREGEGLFRIEGGRAVLFSGATVAREIQLAGLFEIQDEVVLLTEEGDFYRTGKNANRVTTLNRFTLPEGVKVYSSTELKSGDLAIGTISSGIFLFSAEGNLRYRLDKSNGLNNNTILSLFEDKEGNLWAALDNGLSVINLNAPFREFNDPEGRLGVVYTSIVHEGLLYLGTNQGLFFKALGEPDAFQFVPGTRGQVWKLKMVKGELFCGHNNGTYLLRNGNATQVSTFPGTWDFLPVPGKEDLILQGNYQGLSILERRNGSWQLRNKLDGFNVSSRFLEFASPEQLLVSHEFKGIYVLEVDSELQEVRIEKELPAMGIGTSLFKFGDALLYASDTGIYRFDTGEKTFELHEPFTRVYQEQGGMPLGILMPDRENARLWGFGNENLHFLSLRTLDGEPRLSSIPIPNAFRRELGVLGFENITAIDDTRYLIGKSNGYVVLDLKRKVTEVAPLLLRRVLRDSHTTLGQPLELEAVTQLDYGANNLEFLFSAPEYQKYTEVLYRYKLPGLFDSWSPWSSDATARFENLSYGSFNLQVQARVGQEVLTETLSYAFKIARPWYLSNLAILCYAVLLLIFFLLVHRTYRAYYRKKEKRIQELNRRELKRKKLKAKKEVIQLRNEKLTQEIESKNRELAVSTMSLIRKNEFLGKIKEELRKVSDPKQVQAVIRTIDRNINNSDDWKFFEEAFNNADKDFLKKVQEKHPQLTANDLKLCAYLRLNLSSKEIAPLLNISVRSVEVKRYRLRKKMDLPHEMGLTEYILNL